MTTVHTIDIHEELERIQQALKAPKGLYNSFSKFPYRNAAGILEAVKPLLGKCVLIMNDEVINVGDRYYIKATAKLSVGNSNVFATGCARECLTKKGMDEAQITGACSSYARKYALCGLFMIDDSVMDPDSKDNTKTETKKASTTKPGNDANNITDNQLDSFVCMKEALESADWPRLVEIFDAIDGPVNAAAVWGCFDSKQRNIMNKEIKMERKRLQSVDHYHHDIHNEPLS